MLIACTRGRQQVQRAVSVLSSITRPAPSRQLRFVGSQWNGQRCWHTTRQAAPLRPFGLELGSSDLAKLARQNTSPSTAPAWLSKTLLAGTTLCRSATTLYARARRRRIGRIRYVKPYDGSPYLAPSGYVIWAIVVVNVLVYLAWQYASRSPAQHLFMLKNFATTWISFRLGRYHTLLTSAFSHEAFFHLLLNMLALVSFGLPIAAVVGRAYVLGLYCIAGVVGSSASLLYDIVLRPRLQHYAPRYSISRGASGSVLAFFCVSALLTPFSTLLLLGFIPVPLWAGLPAVLGFDLYSISRQDGITVDNAVLDSACHIGGMATGAVFFYLRLRGLRRPLR